MEKPSMQKIDTSPLQKDIFLQQEKGKIKTEAIQQANVGK